MTDPVHVTSRPRPAAVVVSRQRGEPGPPGPQGPIGPPGPQGNAAAAARWSGSGPPPPVIVGAEPGDTYLDLLTGDLYKLI